MSDHVDTLRGDLERLDARIKRTEDAWLDHRVVDFQAWRENRKRLHLWRATLHRELEQAVALEEAEADINYGGEAA